MSKCEINTEIFGNIWFKQMIFNKTGDYKTGHIHSHDHVTLVTNGSVEAFEVFFGPKGREKDKCKSLGIFTAPAYIKVPAGMAHTIVALENDSTAYCLEAIRDGDEVITTDFNDPNYKDQKKYKLMGKKSFK